MLRAFAGGGAARHRWRPRHRRGLLLGLHGLQAQRRLQTQRTAAGRTGHWTLADGSQLWLNAGSEVTVDIGNGHRALHLLRGELLLQTGHHPAFVGLPLTVHVPGARLQPIGTRFAVGREAQDGRLDVFEGVVRCLPMFGAALDVPAGSALQIGPMGDSQRSLPILCAATGRTDACRCRTRR